MAFTETTWYANYGNGTSTGYYAVPQWAATTAYTVGQIIRQLATPTYSNERCYVCIVAGTSAGAEPSWVSGANCVRGVKVTDNTATWQECSGMPGTNGDIVNACTWVASTLAPQGIMIYDAATASLQMCTTQGTTKAAPQPSFSATAGVTTTDNTATWTSLGLASGYAAFARPGARIVNMLTASWGQFATNAIYVESASAEVRTGSGITLAGFGTANTPVPIVCVNGSVAPPTALATTASISTTGASSIAIGGGGGTASYAAFYGIQFNAGDGANSASVVMGGSSGGIQSISYESCKFKLNNTNTGSRMDISSNAGANSGQIWTNCDFIFGNASQFARLGAYFSLIIGGSFALTGTAPSTLFNSFSTGGMNVLRDVDLSGVTGTLAASNSSNAIIFENCKLGSAVTIASNGSVQWGGGYVKAHNCDSTGTNYRYYFTNYSGTVQQETTVVRTGGASNGVTPISWAIVSTANAKYFQPFISEEIAQWNNNSGGAKTCRVYFASNTSLTNALVWATLEYASASGSPLGANVSSRKAILATAAALTTDSGSTWGGGVSNKYYIDLAFTPQMVGLIKVTVYVGGASITVYVDPKLVIF